MEKESKAKELNAATETEGAQGNGSCEDNPDSLTYKSLYLDSQNKIEALTSENRELALRLEIVRGKLAAYEKINRSLGIMNPRMEKAVEAFTCYFLGGDGSDAGSSARSGAGLENQILKLMSRK
ncbi:uncharacterized protein LOC112513779 [Cynara cardunculus var. scolymus]|uniref:uncharacterized protein LOC112513779 n=1 Tax=Cynara cardunculus var. scolymus TaxID=59895 RepID=UPI000D62C052|nr:uncharacterized protein LOC112513779 [Cynara cardunculus var. scolymus]